MKHSIEAQIKLNLFTPRPYQLPLYDAIENKGYKKVMYIAPRRSGKDLVAFNIAIRYALENVCVIYYCFPTFSLARRALWDNITIDGMRVLDYIPEEIIESKNEQQMRIKFRNGSIIQLIGSDNYNETLIGTNPKMIVFSEYALQDPMAYQFARPILAANNGVALFVSCVSPDTLILSDQGLTRIKDVSNSRQEYSVLNKSIYGLGGFHNAEQFYYGGKQETLKVTLDSGYQLECTPIHPIWNGKEWVKSQDLKVGDLIPIQYGQDVWGPGLDISEFPYSEHAGNKPLEFSVANEDFFYLLGLVHADGNYDRNKVCITKKKDPEIIEFIKQYGFVSRPDGMHHEFNSREFCKLLEWIGFKHGARNKSFPEMLFTCTKEEMRGFIQGIFDGDGCSASHTSKRGYVKFTSTNLQFIKDLQVILLNFGIVSSVRYEDKAPTKKVKVWSRIYNLEITGYFAHVFYRDIGFRLERKQRNWANVPANLADESGNVYPVDVERLNGYSLPKWQVTNPERMTRRLIKELNNNKPHPYLQELLSEKFFYSPIKSIEESECEVFDFVIPETHSFFSNGIISHNTPRGKNHMWELYQIAIQSPEWFAYKLTIDDTQHLSDEAWEQEKRSYSEDLLQQEYYCSFDLGVEGTIYGKYIDKLRLRGQIGSVPWENSARVHTAWDIGRDMTAIVFFQTIGQVVRVIDYYEKTNQNLAFFVGILESKPYLYGKHFFPHDMSVTEWSGPKITRLDKVKELGLKDSTIVPDVGLEDGIEHVRTSFSNIWIDEKNCAQLIKCLENYRRVFDDKKRVYGTKPLHNFASHGADAFRYMCLSISRTRQGLTAEELDARFMEARYGTKGTLPPIFQDQYSRRL